MKKELTQIEFKKLEKANKLEQIRKLYIQELYEDNTSLFRESDRAKERKLIYDITNNGKEKEIKEIKWFDLDKLPSQEEFAFDHLESIQLYLQYIKTPFQLPIIGKQIIRT